MKLLLCSPIPTLDPKLGASRVVLDLAEAWRAHGLECDLFPSKETTIAWEDYPEVVGDYIARHGNDYDVVDYPCSAVPPSFEGNFRSCLLVARVVLLEHHRDLDPDPIPRKQLADRIKSLLRHQQVKRRKSLSERVRSMTDANFRIADLINVGNSRDRMFLKRLGMSERKVLVLPYGVTEAHRARLEALPLDRTRKPIVVFIGTFDYRKGCMDFPRIVENVAKAVPDVRFRMLGTRGMFQTEREVLKFFPRPLRSRVEVVREYAPEELPGHLEDCVAGVFPSYREGFGIGVVEMLAAGLPVVAYDSPGPCDILPEEWLVPKGEKDALSGKLIDLLLKKFSMIGIPAQRARGISRRFSWHDISLWTYNVYAEKIADGRPSVKGD